MLKLIRKIINYFRNEDIPFREKTYMLAMTAAAVSCSVGGSMVGIVMGSSILVILPYFALTFVILFFAYLGKRLHNDNIGLAAVVVILNFIVLPITFLTNDGVRGGAPTWFILGAVFIALQTKGATRIILWFVTLIGFSACNLIALLFPQSIVGFDSPSGDVTDSYFAVVLVSAFLCIIVIIYMNMYEDENKKSRKQTAEIERLNQAQNSFFSNMSHEIRTPINTIVGLNEVILRDENISDEVVENATNIRSASNMLLSLINDILDLSKMETGKMNIIPVQYETAALISDIVNIINPQAEAKDLTFTVNASDNVPIIFYGDERRIKQILINVLNNAVKYTKEGSVSLYIDCKNTDDTHCELIFSVRDTGMGIKKESIPYLFDSFQRVDENNNRLIEGTGLGLAICKQLAELMDGGITVDSIYTKGSTFTVSIKQVVVDRTTMNQRDFADVRKKRSKYHQSFEAPKAQVLVVDDNKMNITVVEKLLKPTKLLLDKAYSGMEALEFTRQKRYDIILMDHMMPEMDGIETFRRIRSQVNGLNKDSIVIALTANAGSDSQNNYMSKGFAGYLAKPISGKALEETILKFLKKELITYTSSSISQDEDAQDISFAKRKPLVISTESVADLPEGLAKKLGIKVIPFYVITDNGKFQDGSETNSDELAAYLNDSEKKAISTEPSIEEYERAFGDLLLQAVEVIHLSIASGVSAGYRIANEASKSFANVKVYDSGMLSTGLGIFAIKAAEMAQDGATLESVIAMLDGLKDRITLRFVVPTPYHLYRNNRIPKFCCTMFDIFNAKPTLKMEKACLKPAGFLFGNKKEAIGKFISDTLSNKRSDPESVFVVTTGCSASLIDFIMERAEAYVSADKLMHISGSAAITCNSGPDSVGVILLNRAEENES